jgi:hypothetical protein
MPRNKTELTIGILLVIMPFLGLPGTWKTIFYVLAGLGIIIFAFRSHLRRKSSPVSAPVATAENPVSSTSPTP